MSNWMPPNRAFGLLLTTATLFHLPCAAAQETAMTIQDQFASPPLLSRPRAFWPWLNGNVDRDRIVYELDEMAAKGMGGGEVWDVAAVHNSGMVPAGPEFLSEKSAADVRFALSEGKKRGFRMGMITSSGWNAGGTWVTPDWASKELTVSTVATSGGLTFDAILPLSKLPEGCPVDDNGKPIFLKDIAVLAVPDSPGRVIPETDDIIDLTERLASDGRLQWDVPPGNWHILRFTCTNTGQHLIVPSPNSNGLFIDFLDPEATRRHLKTILDKLGITPDNAAQSGLDYLEVDSMELHKGNPWTDKFGEWYQVNVGYDVTAWLPALAGWTVKDKASTDAFLYDYRKAVSDLLIHSHYETGTAFLKDYGIDFVGEAGGPGPPIWDTCPVDALKALGNVTVPRGEFWIQHRNMFLIKEVASAAHIYGKQIVDAEAFTTWRRYMDSPYELKLSADRAFAEGLNQLTIHTFAHSPEAAGMPGNHYHAGIDINPNTTWWPFARPFMDYLSRCSHVLRQGLPVADVLWYYGDQAPNFFPAYHDVPSKPRLPGLAAGYDYDVINSDVILNRLQVKNGQFILPEGSRYRVLAFAPEAVVSTEVMEKLAELVRAGGVVLGNPREKAPGLTAAAEASVRMARASRELWGDSPTTGARTVGKGKAYLGFRLNRVLREEGAVPDFQVQEKHVRLDFIHRLTPDHDFYFVRNMTDAPVITSATFRTARPVAEKWNPDSGKIYTVASGSRGKGTQTISLDMQPGEAAFYVFADAASAGASTLETFSNREVKPLENPWRLRAVSGVAPFNARTLNQLDSWTKSDDEKLKYFSGIAEYTTTVSLAGDDVTANWKIALSLGKVGAVAKVMINGTEAGITWKPPYEVEVGGLLKPGDNAVAVEVANLWHNRLVKESNTSPTQRVIQSNIGLADKERAPLIDSGLMGPVELVRRY